MNLYRNYIAFYTIVRREWIRTFRIWAGTLLPPIVTTVLYFIIFGHVIGSRLGSMDGFSYLEFIAPGLIMMAVITNSYACTVSGFFSLKFNRDIEEMLVTPMPMWIILTGFMVAGMVRGILVGSFVTIIALFFTHLVVHSLLVVIMVTLLSSAIFSIAGVINAMYAKSFDDISLIPTFVLTPLTYLGGVFYSISLLPVVWQYISMANPIVYIINTFRFGLLGVSTYSLSLELSIMVLILVGIFFLTSYWMKRGFGVKN